MLNPGKCKVMQVCFKRDPPSPPSLQIAGIDLEEVSETKLLGLVVQSDLGWQSQINNMVTKSLSSRRLYMLSRLKRFGVPAEDVVSVYTGYVRPVSEYGVPVWHGSITDCQSDQLERIQKRACRIILGSQYESYTDAVEELNLQTLSDRRIQLCYQFAQKCCDSDRYSKWFQGNSKTHQMSLRHTLKYDNPRCRTDRYKNSPIPFLTNLLNQ